MTVVAMSHGELNRYDTLLRVERGELRIEDAATLLKLSRRRYSDCSVDCMPTALQASCPASVASRATGVTAMPFANR